jgi:competence protein ComGC
MLVTLRIERGMWLWRQFGEHIEADAEVSEKDGLKIVKAPEEMDTPMGKLKPVIILDESKDVILVSLSEAYLEKCRSGKTTLSSSDDFKSATTGFPAKGNGLIYVSRDFCKELVEQVIQVRKNMPKDGEATALFDGLLGVSNLSANDVVHGYACCIANTKSGILIVGNSPMPDKGYGMMSSVAPISAMAAIATPMILKQKKKAQLVQVVSNMKKMYYLFIDYDIDEGKFPEQLEDLVKKGYLKQDTLTMLNSCHADGEDRPLVYIPGFRTSDHSATIIMHTPAPIDGKRTYLRIDGEVKTMKEASFQQLIKVQAARE